MGPLAISCHEKVRRRTFLLALSGEVVMGAALSRGGVHKKSTVSARWIQEK